MRRASRNDTALHRNAHDRGHALTKFGRLQFHLSRAAWGPTRALDELLREIDRVGCGLNTVVVLRARTARDTAWPYLIDETGEVWQ